MLRKSLIDLGQQLSHQLNGDCRPIQHGLVEVVGRHLHLLHCLPVQSVSENNLLDLLNGKKWSCEGLLGASARRLDDGRISTEIMFLREDNPLHWWLCLVVLEQALNLLFLMYHQRILPFWRCGSVPRFVCLALPRPPGVCPWIR